MRISLLVAKQASKIIKTPLNLPLIEFSEKSTVNAKNDLNKEGCDNIGCTKFLHINLVFMNKG